MFNNLPYRLFLTFNATSLIIFIFLIKEQTKICFLNPLPNWVSYIVYLCIPIALTGLSLLVAKYLSSDSIEGKITRIEQANNAFLPSYLGYFFVALSVPYSETLLFIFAVLFIFTFFSQTLYFNPLFLLFGYHFYYVDTDDRMNLFIITKQQLRSVVGISFPQLKRINNFTYIEMEDK